MNNKTACLILADGFEESEAIVTADVLKRLNVNIVLVGLNSLKVRGTHDFYIMADKLISEVSVNDFDALILPGGLPGSINLRDSREVNHLLQQTYKANKICAAICAAPIVLRDSGIAQDKKLTGYPKCEQLSRTPNFKFTGNNTETDGLIITAKGMGKAADFAFAIAKKLGISDNEIENVGKSAFITA